MNVREDYVFFPVPRVASASLNTALGYSTGGNIPIKVSSAPPKIYNHHYTIAFVRNPWDRLLSSFLWYRLQKDQPYKVSANFKTFVKSLKKDAETLFPNQMCSVNANPLMQISLFRPQTFYIDKNVDFVGKIESLNKDFMLLCDKLGKPRSIPKKLRVTTHKPYESYYDSTTARIVEELYHADVNRFRYSY